MKARSLFCALVVFGFAAGTVQAAELKISGGAAPTENIFKPVAEPFSKATGINLVIKANGPIDSVKDLDAGAADLAAAGLTFQSWMDLLTQNGHTGNKAAYSSRVVGRDRIQVMVHQGVAVKELSKDQLKKIFTGEAKNWKEVGGPDLPIVVVFGTKIEGTNKTFAEQAMAKAAFTKSVKEVTDAPSVGKAVETTPGAVGFGPTSLKGGFNTVKTPEIGRPITVITKGAPSADVTKLLDFVRGEGQKYIVQ